MSKTLIALATVGLMTIASIASAGQLDRLHSDSSVTVDGAAKRAGMLTKALVKGVVSAPSLAKFVSADMRTDVGLSPRARDKTPQHKSRNMADRPVTDLPSDTLAERIAPRLSDLAVPVLCADIPCKVNGKS